MNAHKLTGTVQVTAIGMYAAGDSFAIALASLSIVVVGLSRRPRVVDDQIAERDVVDLTVSIDHIVVEGAPGTRFGADLRRTMYRPTADLDLGVGT
jgi:pyruvate/2-oxoglutarate dehydrogenase complex dihydrolipoamide acyltransferase (E2) component